MNAQDRTRISSTNKLGEERNIFCEGGSPEVSFAFNNDTTLTLDADTDSLPDAFHFIKGHSVFTPMLDYKKLLSIHYSPSHSTNPINLYEMFRVLLRDYPIGDNAVLSQIKEPKKYFDVLMGIMNSELLVGVNIRACQGILCAERVRILRDYAPK